MSPWVGMWELVWQSPETWPILTGAILGLTMAGVVLTVFGRGQRQATPAVAIARAQRQPGHARQTRRSRRRRAA